MVGEVARVHRDTRSKTAFLDGPVHYLDFSVPDHEGWADPELSAVQPSNPVGPPLVCVHGLGGSHQNWLSIGPLLAQRRRVFALDLVGFGLTPPSGRSSHVRSHRRLLDRFLGDVVGEPAILVGNSMGGLVSLLQAEAVPESVAGLVLINPALPLVRSRLDRVVVADFAAYALPGLGERTMRRRGQQLTPAQQVERTMGLVTVDPSRVDPEVLARAEELAEQRRSFDWAIPAFLESARSMLGTLAHRRAHRRRVQSVSVPTLVLHGVHDRLVSLAAARELAKLRPDWQLTVLDDVGHCPMLEVPERTVDIIETWLVEQGLDDGARPASVPGASPA